MLIYNIAFQYDAKHQNVPDVTWLLLVGLMFLVKSLEWISWIKLQGYLIDYKHTLLVSSEVETTLKPKP
jgi:hypothetical protein